MTMNEMNPYYRSPVIQLSEATDKTVSEFPIEVQLLKIGKFKDPRYGDFEITSKMLSEMVDNFKKGIRGIKPAIDFKHDTEAEAAAWITNVFTKDNGKTLWCNPEWTGEGQRKLSDRAYGYLSADFSKNYRDNEEGKLHGHVLLGAALTNRPVIKNMKSVIQLSEGEHMPELTPEQLAKLDALMKQLGVSSLEDMITAIAKMKPSSEMELKETELKEANTKLSENSTKLSEALEENKKLKEEKANSDLEAKFNVMLTEGKAIPAQKDAYLKGDVQKFAELAPVGGVKIEETGTEDGNQNQANDDDDDKIMKLAEEKVKKGEFKADEIGKAISAVMKEQKENK
jgi:hypothetical protein